MNNRLRMDQKMDIKNLRKNLQQGKIVVGSEVNEVRSPAIAEVYAAAGLDFIVVDMEHTSFTISEASQIYRMARNCGIAPLVRIPAIEYEVICRNLDQGARGIVVPRITSAEEIHQVIEIMKYPPKGKRGLYPGGTAVGYCPTTPADFIRDQNDTTLLIVQIENQQAVQNLDSILSIPGIDVILIGPADLSLSIGHPCEFLRENVLSLMRKVIQRCRDYKIPSGVAYADPGLAKSWISEGVQFFWVNSDMNMLLTGAKAVVAKMHKNNGQ
jgi:4-hydroxy-2-oxoheptanedioate aldolase